MKYLTKTTGALLVAGCASLLGGCGSSESTDGARLVYLPDEIAPHSLDTSDLTMETPAETVDPQLKEYVAKYEATKAAKPVARPAAQRPAAKPAAPVEPALAAKEDIEVAKKRIDELRGSYKTAKNGAIIEINVDSADTTVDDMKLFGRLFDLETVFFLGAHFNDEYLAQLSELKKLKKVTVQNSDITVETLKMFATYPELTSLDLRRNLKLDNAAMDEIKNFPKLENLAVLYNKLSNSGMNKISKSQTLKVVDVRGCNDGSGVSDSAIRYLTRIPTLEELYFRFEISDAGVEHLKNSQTLKFVELQDCDMLTDASVPHFTSHPSLTGLRIFRCKSFGDAGVQGIASMKLERLELRDLNVGNDGILALKAMGAETLKTVELSELPSVDEAGLNELLGAWKSPTSLALFTMPATDATVKTIVASMPELKTLTLRASQITDAAIDDLVKLEKLETLDLRENNGLSVDAMMKLTKAPSLRRVYVKETALGKADASAKVEEFKKAKPKCAIVL
ncbi:MAG: hypothetical protein IKU86_07955 [Thermoguttaceae bacterium]|nr:hypothetical protein [Thermoguttaceae bacterium]